MDCLRSLFAICDIEGWCGIAYLPTEMRKMKTITLSDDIVRELERLSARLGVSPEEIIPVPNIYHASKQILTIRN